MLSPTARPFIHRARTCVAHTSHAACFTPSATAPTILCCVPLMPLYARRIGATAHRYNMSKFRSDFAEAADALKGVLLMLVFGIVLHLLVMAEQSARDHHLQSPRPTDQAIESALSHHAGSEIARAPAETTTLLSTVSQWVDAAWAIASWTVVALPRSLYAAVATATTTGYVASWQLQLTFGQVCSKLCYCYT